MSASWDSDLSSIIEKTNNNLKLLRKIGDKPQVRTPDVSVTASPASARPRAFIGSPDDAGSTSSRGSARPRAFIRGDDDTSSMGSHGSARPKAYVRGDDDTGSMGSHTSARPKAFIRADDDSGSVSSRASARPKAFIRPEDDAGSASSRSSARPKAFIRADDDSGSVSSRASARPKAFIRGDDDTGSMSSRSSARPKAFIRGDDDAGSMSSNQGLGRSRLDSGHGSVASSSGRPHVGIAGGGGLTAAMLQQHRATAGPAGPGGLAMGDLGAPRARYDLDETRSMSGVSASRLRRPLGANGRVPHARALGASMGPRIRVPDADIPSDIPSHVIDEIKQSLETQFASRNGAVDKKVADLRTDVAGLTTQTSSLSAQMSELRDAVLVSANSKPSTNAPSVSDPKIFASVQANAAAIARLEEHSADLLGRKVSVDRELTELGSRVKLMSSATMKISTLEDNIEALVANRKKQEQGLFKLADRVQLMHRQMGSLVDMKAVENLLSIRLTREFREMEDRLSQNVIRMAEKMEQKVQSMEKQSFSQRQESLAALKNDLTDDIQRLQSSSLRKSDLVSLQNAQTQSKEDLEQLSNALDRQEKKLHDAKLANSTLRDELADARTELNKALQSQQRSAAALMEEKLEHISNSNKEKSSKFDDQLSELAKKQKKLEEASKTLHETMTQVRAETGQRLSRSSADREEENDKLRQRLARSVAELEALATTKAEVERRFASEEQQFQARLKELRSTLTETEKQKEAQRLELMQKLQEESKLMGVAQGKNSLLENLLAREKAENEEKNELVRKSKKEVSEVREQIRNLESEKEKKVRQLTSELQAKQTQVGLLTKTLKRIETASAKMLDLSKREAKTVRRVKATKEHELFIAQLKLKEMERVAQALQNGDEMKKQAALTAASTEERNELEKLLLESQLEKDELKQELEEMTEEFNAAKESQKVIMEDTITKLSSDYDEKISELKQQIADKEQAMRQLRDTLVEKSNLDALEDELAALKDEKNDLLEQIQRAQIEHERVTLKTETNIRLEHATEFAAMKSKFEERISELEDAKSELETTKTTITELEKELEEQEALHQREVSNLTQEIKEARSKIDECTAQILVLEEAKTSLEGEISQMEANIGGASAEKEEELVAIKNQMQSEVDKLRAELAEVSSTLDEKQTQLKDAKQSDEANRQRLVEMAMAQEEMQGRYVSQIDSLTLKLNQERESSRAREQDLEDTIDKLNADVKSLKAESSKELEAARSELTDQMTELTTTLKASQHREQQLQSRLKRILEELVQAANASGENEVAEDVEMSDDEAITHHLDALYATHRRTAHELERLQAEYELTVKQAAADSATAQELDNQVKEHETQINELESVVEQLREELKEQYHKSAIIAKGSDEFSDEMASLREEKRQLERQLQEEEKDRAKREVSYQRRTEMKEREVEELRTENKTLTAAVAAVREKIRAVENVKFQDLGELQNKLKDLEERTAALQPDESNIANMEKDFTATRQEIVTLTAEVQSLYQKLTVCCGIMEWSELRASVFDEEEKLKRVRAENARELAKVESVEQEVLMNAEFLNALLVAHGSTGGDGNLLNDFRWMQKYASIAPEIVEKLRKVESRLRDAVLDGSSSLFSDETSRASVSGDEVVARPPKSQNSAVDGAAIALALEKARDDYFSETSEAAEGLDDEDVKHDVDQPDVEQESVDHEGEGADYENVDAEGQDSIGDTCHDESGTCDDELVVAEHVVRDEQERSHEEQGLISVAMSSLDEDEELSVDVAKDSVKSEQDRNDDDVDGLVSNVDRKIEEMTKIQSKWNSVGFRGDGEDDDMDEVERLMLERSLAHSSKQVNPDIDNECDASDEFATSIVHAETDDMQSTAVSNEVDKDCAADTQLEAGDFIVNVNRELVQSDLSDADQDVRSEEEDDDLDPLEESSFDNAMMLALEGREMPSSSGTHEVLRRTIQSYEEEADQSDSEGYVIQDAITENSVDGSMLSENDDESSETHFANESDVHNAGTEDQSTTVNLRPGHQDSKSENLFNTDDISDSEISVDKIYEQTVKLVGGAQKKGSVGEISMAELSSRMAGEQGDQTDVDDEVGKSPLNVAYETARVGQGSASSSLAIRKPAYIANAHHAVDQSTSSLGSSAFIRGDDLEVSVISVASGELASSVNERNVLEESSSSLDRGDVTIRYAEGGATEPDDAIENVNSLERSATNKTNVERTDKSSSVVRGAIADEFDESNELEESIASIASHDQLDEISTLEESISSVRSATQLESNSLKESVRRVENAELEQHEESDSLEESASSVKSGALTEQARKSNPTERSATSERNRVLIDEFGAGADLEQSTSSMDNTSLAHQDDDKSVVDEPSHSEKSHDRTFSRTHDGRLRDDDDIHMERSALVVSRPDPLAESSFDADMQSDRDDEVSESFAAERTTQSIKRPEGEDEWSEEQIRAAERSQDRTVHLENHPTGSVKTAPVVGVRMEEEDESSEEEETMSVQSQPTFSANLSRFSMGARRLRLEEDDDMDEIERLLLDQSASSMQKNQQQPNRLTRPLADDDDDFGESSLQSPDDGNEFDEDSIRSRKDSEDGEASVRPRDDEFGERLVRSISKEEKKQRQQSTRFMRRSVDDDDEFGESSLQSRDDDENEFGEDSIRPRDRVYNENALERSATNKTNVERTDKSSSVVRGAIADEFDESNELEESIASIASHDQLDEISTLEESISSVRSATQLESNSLKESVRRVENAELEQHEESDSLEESASSVKSGALTEQARKSNPTERSATSERNRVLIDEFGAGADLEQSTSSMDNTSLAHQDDDKSVVDEPSHSEKSHDRTFSRTHDGRLRDDDDIHMERSALVVSRPDPLAESSFDADMQSDRDDEVSESFAAERTTQSIKRPEGEDEWSEEQIRAAERSQDRTVHLENHPTGSVKTAPVVGVRMEEEDESSEEEETMSVQSQPTFSANLSRFSMGARRLRLEEDDDMDEIERLLLDQSASSMQKNQQQPNRLTRPLADDDDDFGESSLQSPDDGNEFDEDSIRSRKDSEDGEASVRPRDDEFGERLVRSISKEEKKQRQQSTRFMRRSVDDDDEFGESSLQSRDDDENEFGEDSIRPRDRVYNENALERSATNKTNVERTDKSSSVVRGAIADEFDESNELEESIASIASHDQLDEISTLEESISSVRSATQLESNSLKESVRRVENAELEQHEESDSLEESASSVKSGALTEQARKSNPTERSATSERNRVLIDEFGAGADLEQSTSSMDNTSLAHQDDDKSVVDEPSHSEKSHDRTFSRTHDGRLRDDDDIHMERSALVVSRPDPLAESSFDADMQSDRDDEVSESFAAERTTQSIKRPEGEDEWSEEQIRAAERSQDRTVHLENHPTGSVKTAPVVGVRMEEEDESSEEEETMSVQSQPTFSANLSRFSMGARRLRLEEDDDMDEIERLLLDQSASSMQKNQQQPNRLTRPLADDDDDFGESSLQSPDDGNEFDEDSIRSRKDSEDGEASVRPRDDEFGERLVRSISKEEKKQRQQSTRFMRRSVDDDDEFGESSLQSRDDDENDEFGETSIKSHQGGNAVATSTRPLEFGLSSIRSRSSDEDEFGEITIRSKLHKEDEFGEASLQSREGTTSPHFRQLDASRFGLSTRSESRGNDDLSRAPDRLRDGIGVGESFVRSREEDEFGEASIHSKSCEEDQVGEASIRTGSYDEDDFGEISIPLDENTTLCPPVPSRLRDVLDAGHSTRTFNFSSRGTIYHEGLMRLPAKSPMKLNAMTVPRDDSASEGDYMDESFDLEESLEEEDNDERLV